MPCVGPALGCAVQINRSGLSGAGTEEEERTVFFLSVVFPKEIIRQKRCIYEVSDSFFFFFLIMRKILNHSLVVVW